MKVVEVMDRKAVANTVHTILKVSIDMLTKKQLDKDDFGKMKVIKTMTPALSAGVMMVQQETAQQRNVLILERMKQLGYGEPRQLDK